MRSEQPNFNALCTERPCLIEEVGVKGLFGGLCVTTNRIRIKNKTLILRRLGELWTGLAGSLRALSSPLWPRSRPCASWTHSWALVQLPSLNEQADALEKAILPFPRLERTIICHSHRGAQVRRRLQVEIQSRSLRSPQLFLRHRDLAAWDKPSALQPEGTLFSGFSCVPSGTITTLQLRRSLLQPSLFVQVESG